MVTCAQAGAEEQPVERRAVLGLAVAAGEGRRLATALRAPCGHMFSMLYAFTGLSTNT